MACRYGQPIHTDALFGQGTGIASFGRGPSIIMQTTQCKTPLRQTLQDTLGKTQHDLSSVEAIVLQEIEAAYQFSLMDPEEFESTYMSKAAPDGIKPGDMCIMSGGVVHKGPPLGPDEQPRMQLFFTISGTSSASSSGYKRDYSQVRPGEASRCHSLTIPPLPFSQSTYASHAGQVDLCLIWLAKQGKHRDAIWRKHAESHESQREYVRKFVEVWKADQKWSVNLQAIVKGAYVSARQVQVGKSWEDLLDIVHAFDTLERLDDKSREQLLRKEKFRDFVASALAIMDEEEERKTAVETKRKNAGKKDGKKRSV